MMLTLFQWWGTEDGERARHQTVDTTIEYISKLSRKFIVNQEKYRRGLFKNG